MVYVYLGIALKWLIVHKATEDCIESLLTQEVSVKGESLESSVYGLKFCGFR